jgi:hypothetical protein
MVVHSYNLCCSRGKGRRTMSWKTTRTKVARLYIKNNIKTERDGSMAQVVDGSPSICKILGSISSMDWGNDNHCISLQPHHPCFSDISEGGILNVFPTKW